MANPFNQFEHYIMEHANVLANIARSLHPVVELLTWLMYIMGLLFAFKAIYCLRIYGEARTMMSSHTSVKEPIVYLIIATMFIYSKTAFDILMVSSFGYSSPLSYSDISVTHNSLFESSAGKPLAFILQVIGLSAFIRGWVLIGRASGQSQQPGGTGKGLMHVFGGILAMNIVGTLNIISNTLFGT